MCKRLLQPLLVQHNPCPDLDSSGRVVIYCRRRPFPTHSRVWPHHAPPTRGKDERITPSPLILTALQITRLPSSPGLSSWPPCFFCRISIDLLRCNCWCGKYQLRRNTERYFSFRLWFPLFPSDSDRCTRHSFGFCSKCTAGHQRGNVEQ